MVMCFRHSDDTSGWYKFDDGDVSEAKMDDDEEMRNQCFGGDYVGEVRHSFSLGVVFWCACVCR